MNALAKAVPSAPLVSPDGENLVFLLGAPRSGTTWLAKIFDSHPDVVYRHEPDTVLRNDDVPYLCTREDIDKYRDDARDYLLRLMDIRTLKSAGSLPLFGKHFRGPVSERLRAGIVYSLHAADTVSRRSPWPRRITIPDLIAGAPEGRPTFVFKSISSRGRMRLFGEALPKSKIIFILRHPCGQVLSTMQGISKGKFERNDPFKAVLVLDEAKRLGMTAERFATFSPLEQCAWHWTILNQKALNDLASLSADRTMVIRYEDACADPMRLARELLGFAGLDWNNQTVSFVSKSTSAGDTSEFYGTSRDPMRAANKWRGTLAADDQRRIMDIASQVPAGQMFAEAAT